MWSVRARNDPDSVAGPFDVDRHHAVRARGEAHELLKREPLEAATLQIGGPRLIDAKAACEIVLFGHSEPLEDRACELPLEPRDGVGRLRHACGNPVRGILHVANMVSSHVR